MTYNSRLLDGMVIFASVVDAAGFSAAGKRLGHSTSHVSKTVSDLEQRLGVRLLNRTTRSISLTDDGRAYYDRCRIILEVAEEASAIAEQRHAAPKGTLRLTAPVSFGLSHLSSYLPGFMDLYPGVTLDVELNDRMADLVADGFDLAIRIGHLDDSSLISTKLSESRSIVVASPAYWKRYGHPAEPEDLAGHRCISYSNLAAPGDWEFVDAAGQVQKISVPVIALCNSAEMEIALAVAGKGITRIPEFACKSELESGALEIVLSKYEAEPMGIYAIYPHRAHLSAKVRAFVDFLRERLLKGADVTPRKEFGNTRQD